MDSASHNHALPLRYLVLSGCEICYHQKFHCIASDRFGKFSSAQSVFRVNWHAYPFQHQKAIGISIGIAVSKVNFILTVIQFYRKAQRI